MDPCLTDLALAADFTGVAVAGFNIKRNAYRPIVAVACKMQIACVIGIGRPDRFVRSCPGIDRDSLWRIAAADVPPPWPSLLAMRRLSAWPRVTPVPAPVFEAPESHGRAGFGVAGQAADIASR
jgi:hypothetical protein